ncbi:MAG: hypothetical protein R3F59_37450 [Myxococcota bacterium]
MSAPGLSLMTLAVAHAAPQAAPFAIETPSGRFEVAEFPSPPARSLPEGDRICAVRLAWNGKALTAHDAGCPDVVEPEVLYTVEQWRVTGPATASELAEVWFVYPFDRIAPPRVLVRQSPERTLSLPPDIDAVPYLIRAWSFLRYPTAVHHEAQPDVSCMVHVEADARGFTTEVVVEGCEEPYVEAARSAVQAWRFAPMEVDGGPIATALSLRTTFVARPPAVEPEYVPSEESARLWANRQFDAMSRTDRIWFIRAALLGPSEAVDLGPGQVRVALPRAPDLGGRPAPTFDRGTFLPPPPSCPTDPILRLGEPNHDEIRAYTLISPARARPRGALPRARPGRRRPAGLPGSSPAATPRSTSRR